MFASRALLFAKTSVKEPVKAKRLPPGGKIVETPSKLRDPSKPPLPGRFSLPQIISFIPKPETEDRSQWKHKNGWGLKFYRSGWARYTEPCYWTVTRFKPSTHDHKPKVWGVLTWRGVTEAAPREVAGCRKREWKYLQETDFSIPFPSVKQAAADKASATESAEPAQ